MDVQGGRRGVGLAGAWWLALLSWVVAWVLMLALDGHVDLANQALLLILASAVASLGSGAALSAAAIGVNVLAFNFAFVPPRGTLSVDLRQHGLLLVAMVSVSWIITALMVRLRRSAAEADEHARRSEELRRFGDALRETEDPLSAEAQLRRILGHLTHQSAALLVRSAENASDAAAAVERWFGEATVDEQEGLRLCARDGRGLGPGSGRHEEQMAWYLPLRGRQRTHGAALVRLHVDAIPSAQERAHAQALCDQLGVALERAASERAEGHARQQAQLQAMRNTLLSAVAHDHRTPLAAIISAAGALHDQADRLDDVQRRRLAATIVDEATQLARITDNTLQLARLDAVGLDVAKDWESLEELIGSVMRRVRQRDPGHRLRARVDPDLPLVRCDAVLIVQLIDNLVDNALKHGGEGGPVEVTARQVGQRVVVAVRDRGPGVAESLGPRIFDAFSRGPAPDGARAAATASARGTGVGLALCRAIARVHGGELSVRARRGGGASFELSLPVEPMPAGPSEDATPGGNG
jgi:two-component system sensor histidine kinase KdpD